MGRALRKRVFGHMRTAKAKVNLLIRACAQSDPGIHWPLTESCDTAECMNWEQMAGWYFAHAQDDLKLRILRTFRGLFFACRGSTGLVISRRIRFIVCHWSLFTDHRADQRRSEITAQGMHCHIALLYRDMAYLHAPIRYDIPEYFIYFPLVLTQISRTDFPILIHWVSPFVIKGVSGVFFFHICSTCNWNSCKQTVKTLIRRRITRRLIKVCTVCLCPTKGLYSVKGWYLSNFRYMYTLTFWY